MSGDYSFVKEPDGRICGMWIRDPSELHQEGGIEALLLLRAEHLLRDYVEKRYRRVTNRVDSAGGCFVMFGSARAPGE